MFSAKGLSLSTAILVALVAYFTSKKTNVEAPLINAPIGDLSGIAMQTRKGRTIFAYQGIPYAEPPVNQLRFKKPKALSVPAWAGTFAATSKPNRCVQMNSIKIPFFTTMGDENCLQLNVYVPKTDTKKPLPVMVWFHGGGFTSGDSSDRVYGPKYLLDKDVILVTANYRLGIFGFFTLGHTEAPGNLAMWDQHESLKWVQANIASFGGDPNKVTIFGESSGGISVSYQLASRKNSDKGLFHAAIIQSGPIDLPSLKADVSRPIPDIHAEFAEKMGCPFDRKDVDRTMTCLQNKPAHELQNGLKMFDQCSTVATAFPNVWGAYDDHDLVSDPFFADSPRKIFEKGLFIQVPTIVGATRDEGILNSGPLLANPELLSYFKTNWDECSANHFLGKFFLEKPLPKDLVTKADKIKEFYFGENGMSIDSNGMQNLTNAFSDHGYLHGTDTLAKQLSKKVKTFYYQFDHIGSFSLGDMFARKPIDLLWTLLKKVVGIHDTLKLGASHCDDLLYLFSMSLPITILPDDRDQKMIDFMVELWSNFATFHNPTPNSNAWPAYGTNGQTYVRLDDSKIILEPDLARDERLAFCHNVLI